MNSKEPKYRPVFTLPQLHHLRAALSSHSVENSELQLYLDFFIAKCTAGYARAAYTTAPKPSLEDKLGLGISKEDKLEAAYTKYIADPRLCSQTELQLADEYRYLNDLMTPEEESDYETRTA